ncbi:MAG TPA: hypothetical protein VLE97_01730 [Gaiellaceae bacterium]|nr:hypothetical protein [Gaiellaceae bacterium]
MGGKQENRTSHEEYSVAKDWLRGQLEAGIELRELSDAAIGTLVSNGIGRATELSKSTVRDLREALGILRSSKPKPPEPPTREEFDLLAARVAGMQKRLDALLLRAGLTDYDLLVPTTAAAQPPDLLGQIPTSPHANGAATGAAS